jgi:chromatin remodeling complex protein RSC6
MSIEQHNKLRTSERKSRSSNDQPVASGRYNLRRAAKRINYMEVDDVVENNIVVTVAPKLAPSPALSRGEHNEQVHNMSVVHTDTTTPFAGRAHLRREATKNVNYVEVDDDDDADDTDNWMNGDARNIDVVATVEIDLKEQIRALIVERDKYMVASQRASNIKSQDNRAPCRFIKPTIISDELATFLGRVKGINVARTEVTKEINAYIRTNKLQDPTNCYRIIPDAALAKLLKLNKSDELAYFNLQNYLSYHFPKSPKALAAAAAMNA